jgi:hypothetical protein
MLNQPMIWNSNMFQALAVLLGDTYVRTTRFAPIGSGTSGGVSLPPDSEVVLDDFGGDTDAVITTIASGRPTFQSAVDSSGVVIATTFDASGNYVLTGTPSAYPVAIVYRVRQKLKDFDSTSSDIIGDFSVDHYVNKSGDTMTGTLIVPTLKAQSSAGLQLQNQGGTTIADFGAGGGVNATITAPLNITGRIEQTGNTDSIQLRVRGNATQTVDLQQWQDSSGTVLSAVKSDGVVVIGNNGTQVGTYQMTVVGAGSSSYIGMKPVGQSGFGFSFGVPSAQNSEVWNYGTGYLRFATNNAEAMRIDSSGLVNVGTTGLSGQFNVQTSSASIVGSIIRASASQSADLTQWQDSSSTVLSRVLSNGFLRIGTSSSVGSFSDPAFSFGSSSCGMYSDNNRFFLVAQGAFAGGFDSTGFIGNSSWFNASSSADDVNVPKMGGYRLNVLGLQAGIGGDSNGHAAIVTNNLARILALQDGRISFFSTTPPANTSVFFRSIAAPYKAFVVQGAVLQSGNLLEFQDSSATSLSAVTSSGNFQGPAGSAGAPTFSFYGFSNNGMFKPSGDVLAFSTASSERMRIGSTGLVSIGSTGGLAQLGVVNNSAGGVAFIVRGAASQSANLTQWQDSSGTAVSTINSLGHFTTTQTATTQDPIRVNASGIAANSQFSGVWLENSTAATSSNQQFAPGIVFSGQVWSTSVAGSYSSRWRIVQANGQQFALGRSNLQIQTQENGGGWQTSMTITPDAGVLTGTNGNNGFGAVWADIGPKSSASLTQADNMIRARLASNVTGTSGTANMVNIYTSGAGFNPTSGTAELNGFSYRMIINQTGGANGITRGMIVAPTLTAAADFRSFESQVGGDTIIIGRNTGSAAMQIDSTTRGFLLPRMTTAQRTAISSPTAGLMVFDTDTLKSYTYDGTNWQAHY